MPVRKLLSIGGMPGTGKTTLMRLFMNQYSSWTSVEPVKMVNCMYQPDLDLYVIGKYEDQQEVFAGSDKLSMAVQPAAIEFVSNTKSNILVEGDRLFTTSFIEHLFGLPDSEMAIFILETDNHIREQRYQDRGSEQNEKWLAGRRTKVANVEKQFAYNNRTKTFKHNTLEDMEKVKEAINSYFQGNLEFDPDYATLDDLFDWV